jgi:cytoskeletal protein CcmA (bactofilin family)
MGFFSRRRGRKAEEEEKKEIEDDIIQVDDVEPIEDDRIETPTKDISILKSETQVKADISGEGSLILGGLFDGNISIADTVFIDRGAYVKGVIKAKNVKISGKFEGAIYATAVEVTSTGDIRGVINSTKAFLGGSVRGAISSLDSIEIRKTGSVESQKCTSRMVKIAGEFQGRIIATKVLELASTGSLTGEIISQTLNNKEGGKIDGTLRPYNEEQHGGVDPIQDDRFSSEAAKLINISPADLSKYAKKRTDEKEITTTATKE